MTIVNITTSNGITYKDCKAESVEARCKCGKLYMYHKGDGFTPEQKTEIWNHICNDTYITISENYLVGEITGNN